MSPTMQFPFSTKGWDNWTPQKIRERKASAVSLDEPDTEDEDLDLDKEEQAGAGIELMDQEMRIMRRVFKKWARIAGVECTLVDELKEGEFEVDWTKAIAPRIEGRIVCVGGEQK